MAVPQAALETALARALAVAQCLAALHASGRLHGGVCPQALHTQPDGTLCLNPPPPAGQALTLEQLRYASPEQASSQTAWDGRSDLYSLGLLLYEWLLGQPAFASGDALELAYQQIQVLPTPPQQHEPALPRPVCEIVMRLLAKAPAARYASAHALADDVRHCLQALGSQGHIPPFALGRSDLPAQWAWPERLYGRAATLDALQALWQRAVQGTLQLCLLHGEAGVGKTTLVRTLQVQVQAAGGTVAEGRFAVAPDALPRAAVLQAISDLLHQALASAPAVRAQWRSRLLTIPGARLAVLQEALPELQWLIGPQAPASLLVGLAAQQRLHACLSDVLTRVAGPQQPLMLFLDDAQGADPASLAWLLALLRDKHVRHVLLVAACRSQPAQAHPVPTRPRLAQQRLARLRAALRKDPARGAELALGPLSAADLAALLDHSCPGLPTLAALCAWVMQETGGNPLAIRECLMALVAQGRLRYEPQALGWRWTPAPAPGHPATPLWLT